MRAERRVVTVMAVDVVGSTPLVEQLGPEDARLVLGETLARAVTVVEAYGGTVKDLAGDGVLALFGAPVAHDDDAERAVRAATDILADVRRQSTEIERGWGLAGFDVRVGLHTGEVVVGDVGAGGRVEYGAVGDTVHTTSRLQSVAPPGGILLSAVTARLVEDLTELGPLRTVELKGKAEPVAVHELRGLRPQTARRPGRCEVIVGRVREVAESREVLQRLAGGEGGILWITGDPGLGKTRLLAELATVSAELGLGWAEGRCASYGESLPYWPIRELLRGFVGVGVQDPELKQRLAARRTLERLLPDRVEVSLPYLEELLGVGEAAVGVSPEARQYRGFEVVGELLAAWSAVRPGVVVLDDLHWADPSSLGLVESLLARTESDPLLLVLAMRPETARPAWELRERALREYRHLSRDIALRPLGPGEEQELIGRLLAGTNVPDETAGRLAAFAAGNPFYLEELVTGLHDGDGSTLDIPETLEAVILARVDRLEPDWRHVLTTAAPLGRSFGLPLLGGVSGLEESVLRTSLHHLRRLDLLTEESRVPHPVYRFKHALIQEAVERSLLGEDRAALHRRAAEWLERNTSDRVEAFYPLLAHHWLAAGESEPAMRYARMAGDQARDNNALEEAATHYRTLVDLLDSTGRGGEAAGVLFQLGTTLLLAARFREAQEVWDRAFVLPGLPPPAPLAEAELRIGANQMPWDPHPWHGFHAANMVLCQQLYDPLLEPAEGPIITPGLAERWHVSADGRVLTVTLRPNLQWNDGAPLDAAEIASSIRASMLPEADNGDLPILMALEGARDWVEGAVSAETFPGVRALDPRTLEFRLGRPAPYFLFVLLYPSVGPYRPDGTGTGPFEIERMDGTEVVLRRAEGYRRRRGGNVARIRIRPYTDRRRNEAFLQGEVDVTLGTDTAHGDVVTGPPVLSVFLMANGDLTDRHALQALAAAVDRDRIRAKLAPFTEVATGGLVPPGLPGHTPDVAPAFDPDRARDHLARSSRLQRGDALLVSQAFEQEHPWFDDVVAGWRDILGLDVRVRRRSMADNLGFAELGDHLSLWHWVAGYPDPDYFLYVLLHGASAANLSHWSNAEFDTLIDKATGAVGSERMNAFHEADRMAVSDECIVIPLVYRRLASLVRPGVHGWWHWGAPLHRMNALHVEPVPG